MRRGLRRFLIASCTLVACVAAATLVVLRVGRPLFYTDGSRGHAAVALADQPMLVWGAPQPEVELPGPVQGRACELPDGTFVYGRVLADGTTDLVTFDPRRPDLEPVPLG